MRLFHTNFLAKVSDIVEYNRNAREHSDSQISQIVASIREFGFTNPLLVDEANVVIAGHGRLAAAKRLGMAELPAIVLEGLSEAQKQALRIADNKIALNSAWNDEPGPLQCVSHDSLVSANSEPRQQIIWAKDRFALGRGHYHYQHEPCWYAVRNTAHWAGDRSQSTLWQIAARDDSGHGHATQKPVECMRRPIENNSSPGQAVYDPFVGSGTTIIAAEMTGRACHAIEISPNYVDCGIIRWQNFTGAEATLERTGQTYSEVAACRSNADIVGRSNLSVSSGSTSEVSTPLGASHATA